MKTWEWVATAAVAVGLAFLINAVTDLVLVAEPVHSIAEYGAIVLLIIGAIEADNRITRAREARGDEPVQRSEG